MKIKRFLVLLLSLALLLCTAAALAACGGDPTPPVCQSHKDADGDGICDTEGCDEPVAPAPPAGGGDDDDTEYFNENGELILYKGGVPTFTVVTGNDIGINSDAVDDLVVTLNRLSASPITLSTYSSEPTAVEILIGTVNTRGEEYKLDKYSLGENGYAVKQVGTKLLVQGGSTIALGNAITHLKSEVFGIKRANEPFTDFVASADKTIHAPQSDYPLSDVKIAGNSIRDGYVITYTTGSDASKAATELQTELYKQLGIRLETKREDSLAGDEKYIAIRLIENDRKSIGFTANVTDDGNLVVECMLAHKIKDTCAEYFDEKVFDLPKSADVASFPAGTADTKDLRNICYDDEEFGAVGDGVTDDFDAIYAAHTEANVYGLIVHATPGKTYRIGPQTGRYSIPVKTSTYWHGASFIFDDKGIVQDDVEYYTHIFHIQPDVGFVKSFEGDDVPIDSLKKGASNLGYAPGFEAYVIVYNANVRHYIRSGTWQDNGSDQHEFILVDKDGNIDPTTRVQWTYDTVTKLEIYNIDDEEIEFLGADGEAQATVTTNFIAAPFTKTDMYTSRNICVTRSNVIIKNIRHEIIGEDEATSGVPYDGFVCIQSCSDVRFENMTFQRPKRWTNTISGLDMSRSYEIRAGAVNNLQFINCDQSNFFHNPDGTNSNNGMMGTNYCRNMLLDGCTFNTFDAHCGVYNATIKNTTLVYLSIIGAGKLEVDNVTFYAARTDRADAIGIWMRDDYGCTFDGDFYLKDITIKYNKFPSLGSSVDRTISIISATHDPSHYFGYQTYLPRNLYIDGVTAIEIDVKVVDGERIETEVARNNRPVYIFPAAISDIKNDISISSLGGGKNPYIGTENFYFKNCEDVELIYPTAPQFKNSTVNIYDEATETYIQYVYSNGEYVLPEE